jgi:hypothetical protein
MKRSARFAEGILASGRQLVGMLTAENNRLPTAPKAVLLSVSHGSHIKWLEKELSLALMSTSTKRHQGESRFSRE